jgi:hypothetical protein
MKTMNTLLLGSVLVIASTAGADVIGYEDFDGGAINLITTTNVFDFGAGGGAGGDVFGRVSQFNGGSGTGGPFDVWDDSVSDTSGGGVFASDVIAVAGQNSSAFFAMNDSDAVLDGSGAPLNNAVWQFDISSAISITDIQIDIGAFGDFEASSTDGFLIEAQIDGGGWNEIFKGRTNEAINHTYRAFDDGDVLTVNDPLELFIDGSGTAAGVLDKSDPTSGAFDTYTSLALAGSSGSVLEIRISWAGTPSGSEPMGMDNITINGTIPAPGVIALLGVAGLVGRRRRRH